MSQAFDLGGLLKDLFLVYGPLSLGWVFFYIERRARHDMQRRVEEMLVGVVRDNTSALAKARDAGRGIEVAVNTLAARVRQ